MCYLVQRKWFHHNREEKFRTRYLRTAQFRNTILNWVRKFELRWNVENRNASRRPPITPQTVQPAWSYFRAHPRRSQRRAQTDLQVPHTAIHKILKVKIHMFTYKIGRLKQLNPHDILQTKHFAVWCLLNVRSDLNFLRLIVFSDECVFHLSRIANNENARF